MENLKLNNCIFGFSTKHKFVGNIVINNASNPNENGHIGWPGINFGTN